LHQVAILWTSPPLGNYSYDTFSGYSPPVVAKRHGLALSWPRSMRIALRFVNNDRNLQVPLPSIEIRVGWSAQPQPLPFAPSDLSTPPANLAAVRRGPLLFALPLHPTVSTLQMPAKGGECESANASTCKSADLEFTRSDDAPFNYALVLSGEASDGLDGGAKLDAIFRRRADAPGPIPFAPDAPPVTVSASARRVARWGTTQGGKVAESPPASPLECSADDGCGDLETLELVPFGSTQVRIGAFPWTTKSQ